MYITCQQLASLPDDVFKDDHTICCAVSKYLSCGITVETANRIIALYHAGKIISTSSRIFSGIREINQCN